ncbi:nuclear transport factor 2 family protein [Paucibacter soli]|uniref:nuclear transport factor 2 family protein n=1 Tax=Paucibacter soli TaxID=3133433 RepID=UPI0030B45B5A
MQAGNDLDDEAILELERRVWRALQRGDAAADAALLSEDFVGVYPSGLAGKAGHVEQLADGPTVAEFELSEPRVLWLGSELAMLSYRARWRRPARAEFEHWLVSSLWRRHEGRWQNCFSQDTLAAM